VQSLLIVTVERRDLFGAQDAAEALRLLAARARVAADLDEHVGLRDVDAVVAHLGQEQRVDLRCIQTEGTWVSKCACRIIWNGHSVLIFDAPGTRPPVCKFGRRYIFWHTTEAAVVSTMSKQSARCRPSKWAHMARAASWRWQGRIRTLGLCLKACRMRVRSAWLVPP